MTAVSRSQDRTYGYQRGHDVVRGVRGLLHDLAHQLMTLSLLAESVRTDDAVRGESRRRMELVHQEMFRAMDMITDHLADQEPATSGDSQQPADLRELAGQAAQLAELAYGATVEVLPGEPVIITSSPTAAWRVLSNLVDNAARSAGPDGHVHISVRTEAGIVLDVLDDGDGLGQAPAGMAGIGLSVVRQLVERAGGRLEICDRPEGGTRARVLLSEPRARVPAPALAGTWS
jgi:signal transduction histidine kinase